MPDTMTTTDTRARRTPKIGIIDCDVHPAPASRAALKAHMPARWHRDLDRGSHLGGVRHGLMIGSATIHTMRRDAIPASGVAGSDLAMMREQLLDAFDVEKAILIPLVTNGWPLYGEFAEVYCSAINEWLASEFLDQDERLYGAIVVPLEDGPRAKAEIARAAQYPHMVQVHVPSSTREGLGHPKYWPIYEAAVEHGMSVAPHIGGWSGSGGATGWNTYFLEWITRNTHAAQAHVTSLVFSGVFDRYPELQIVMVEQGLGWLGPLMWRLDRTWSEMREDLPHLKTPPSQVIREHFWVTTQPLDAPPKAEHLIQMIDHLDMDDRIVFASDYPHFDFDNPARTLPQALGQKRTDQIMFGNAASLFGWKTEG